MQETRLSHLRKVTGLESGGAEFKPGQPGSAAGVASRLRLGGFPTEWGWDPHHDRRSEHPPARTPLWGSRPPALPGSQALLFLVGGAPRRKGCGAGWGAGRVELEHRHSRLSITNIAPAQGPG